MVLKDEFKRINRSTGKPFTQGYQDENGRIFYSYVNKIGNDGWYLEEWKKDFDTFVKKAEELNINYDSNLQSHQ